LTYAGHYGCQNLEFYVDFKSLETLLQKFREKDDPEKLFYPKNSPVPAVFG
jgi:hypothetical protein